MSKIQQQSIKLQRQLFMINSKSIKLLITNNQAHRSFSKEDIISNLSPDDDYEIDDLELADQFNQDYQRALMEQKDMFTIREEESYDYDSQGDSICIKNQIQSHLDSLSTIRAENRDHFSAFQSNKQLLDSQVNLRAKLNNENITMCSINGNKSNQLMFPLVQAWEQKLKEPLLAQQVQQEEFFALKSSEKGLRLDKMKVQKSFSLFKNYQAINLKSSQSHYKYKNQGKLQMMCCNQISADSTVMVEDLQNDQPKNKAKKSKIVRIKIVKGIDNKNRDAIHQNFKNIR